MLTSVSTVQTIIEMISQKTTHQNNVVLQNSLCANTTDYSIVCLLFSSKSFKQQNIQENFKDLLEDAWCKALWEPKISQDMHILNSC